MDEIVAAVASGIVPACLQNFTDDIEVAFQVVEQVHPWDVADRFQRRMEMNQDIKVSMLHEAGRMAKKVYYLEEGETAIRLV